MASIGSKGLAESIPQYIVPYSPLSDLQSLATTSKEIRHLTINGEAGKFIGQLVPLLKDKKQISDLNKIKSKLNSKIELTKEKIIHVLKDSDTLEPLKQVPVPGFFEKIFEIAEIHRRIPLTNALPDGAEKNKALQEIAKSLMNLGRTRDAIEIAYTMPDGEHKADTLLYIAKKMIEAGKINRAIGIVNNITDGYQKACLHAYIAETLNKNGNNDLAAQMIHIAIETAHTLPNGPEKAELLADIAHKLTDAGAIDWAIDIANALPADSDKKTPALEYIIAASKKAKNFHQTIRAINAISNQDDRRNELIIAIADLAELELIDWAINIAETYFPDEPTSILAEAAGRLANWGTVDRAVKLNLAALKIAKTLPEGDEKEEALQSIDENWSEFISCVEDFEYAIEFADLIQNTEKKAENLCWIAKNLVSDGKIVKAIEMNDRALELAEVLSEGQEKTTLLSHIAIVFADTRTIKQAIDVVKEMPNGKSKARSLKYIAHKVCNKITVGITITGISLKTIDRSLDEAKEIPGELFQAVYLLAIADVIDSMAQSDDEKKG